MKNVLFICTGNTCRSPMAEVIFNSICEKSGLDMHAKSAGLATVSGLGASENAKKAVEEIGLDLSGHKSTFLPECNLSDYDLFVTMNYSQADILKSMGIPDELIRTLQRHPDQNDRYDIELGIMDPFGKDINVYRKCRDEIMLSIKELIKTL